MSVWMAVQVLDSNVIMHIYYKGLGMKKIANNIKY